MQAIPNGARQHRARSGATLLPQGDGGFHLFFFLKKKQNKKTKIIFLIFLHFFIKSIDTSHHSIGTGVAH
jgi:hypothetical protein